MTDKAYAKIRKTPIVRNGPPYYIGTVLGAEVHRARAVQSKNPINYWRHFMKSEIRMALLVLATTSAPAFAQGTPQCSTFYDNAQQFFTATGAPEGALNTQCFLTVMP